MGIVNNVKKELDKVLADTEGSSEKIHKDFAKLTVNAKISNHSKVGTKVGVTVNGMKTLNIAVDDVNDKVTGSAPKVVISSNVPIVQITEDLKTVGSQLKTAMDDSTKNLLKTMTGLDDVVDEMQHVIISAGLPQAIAQAAKTVLPTTVANDLKEIVRDLSDLDGIKKVLTDIENTALVKDLKNGKLFDDVLGEQLDDLAKAVVIVAGGGPALSLAIGGALINTISKDAQQILNRLGNGFDSLIENAVEAVTLNATNAIIGIIPELQPKAIKDIIALIAVGNIDKAVNTLVKINPKLKADEVRNTLKSIDNKGSKAIAKSNPPAGVTEKVRNVEKVDNLYKGIDSPEEYWTQGMIPNDKITTELRAVFNSLDREITGIVILSTDTGTNIKLDGKGWVEYFLKNEAIDPPTHYLITNEDFVQRVIPAALPVQQSKGDGWDERALFIAIQGGVDGPEPERLTPVSEIPYGVKTVTTEQWNALDKILRAAYSVWPGLQVVGYDEIGWDDNGDFRPHFNVEDYVKSKFDKDRTIDPSEDAPLRKDLVAHEKQSVSEESEVPEGAKAENDWIVG